MAAQPEIALTMKTEATYAVVVTDLDDTLFDWVGLWHKCFSAMLDRVLEVSGLDREVVLDDFRTVHQRHGTAEYAFALEELACLLDRDGSPEAIREKYAGAIEAYRHARRKHLCLYPTVLEGLVELRGRGCLVVGYTESLAFYANYRVRRLGLDGILDYLFSPEDHDIPDHLSRVGFRHYGEEAYRFRHTIQDHTPKGELKPNPKVLADIIAEVGAKRSETIYVGDKLHKDVLMAKRAGVMDVHARYGQSHEREEYELLKRVTNWTPEMVKKEAKTTQNDVKPTHVIDRFGELLDVFCFRQFEGNVKRK
jgi:phosphoglycolate phosphatase